MKRKFTFAPYEYYHIYNRGVDKRQIFMDTNDYERFIKLLYLANSTRKIDIRDIPSGKEFEQILSENLVEIGAWCLMPNHFHLLVRVKDSPKGSPSGVSMFMNKIQTGYSMYFNKKYRRSGSLFQGPFKAQHADDDIYLQYLFSYIHLNPLKLIDPEWKNGEAGDLLKSKEFLLNHHFSSYSDYLGTKRKENKILSIGSFPKYFERMDSFEIFIDSWINSRRVALRENLST